MTKAVDPQTAAHTIALRQLEVRPRTRHELAVVLTRRNIPDEATTVVLDRLEAVGLVDDAAFATAWVESRHSGRRLGRRALAEELRRKGIPRDLIDAALCRVTRDDEAAAARELIRRRMKTMRGLDRSTATRRLASSLARRGIPGGIADDAIREALAGSDA